MLKILQSHSQCHQHHQIAVPAFARWCCQWWSYSYLQWAVCTTWRWKSQCPPCHRWAPIPQSATASRYLTVMGASSFNDRFFPGTRTPACRSLSCNKKHTEHNYWRHVLMLVHDSTNIVYGYISCVYYISFYISLYIVLYIFIYIYLYIFIYLDNYIFMSQYKHPKIAEISYFPTQHPGAARWFLGPPLAACHRLPWRPTTSPACDTTCDTKTKWSVIRAATCTHIDIAYLLPIYIEYIHINLYKLHTHITYLIHSYI